MSNEIKVGDTVRVSDATPWIYTRNQYKGYDCNVEAVAGDGAIVSQLNVKFPIPTKYLVNVDAEAKEAKYHKGDRVRHIKNDECGIVLDVEADGVYVGVAFSLQRRFWKNREIEPVQPTEQTETSADALGSYTLIPVSVNPIIGFEQEYWKKYAADLAKEIALKVANKFNDPEQAVEYAVKVAKAVVEGLKRE